MAFLTNILRLIFQWTIQWVFEAVAGYLVERKALKDREELQKQEREAALKKLENAKTTEERQSAIDDIMSH